MALTTFARFHDRPIEVLLLRSYRQDYAATADPARDHSASARR